MKIVVVGPGAFGQKHLDAVAKIAGVEMCWSYNRQYGTRFINLMPCNLYGYNDHFEPERSHVASALIYKFHQAKLKGLPSSAATKGLGTMGSLMEKVRRHPAPRRAGCSPACCC